MATHSCVLAWRIPGTGEPGGLPCVGLHRVGHDRSDLVVVVAVVKNPPSSAGGRGSIPVQGTKIAQAMGQLSLSAVTTEALIPQLRPTQSNK